MYIYGQNFLVLGVSKSGYAVASYLLNHGANCYLFEDLKSPKITQSIEELLSLGAKVFDENDETAIKMIDCLVISPGVPINHRIAVKCKSLGIKIIGELEFGYLQLNPIIVSVTGTNGKTTTVSLISSILESAGKKNKLVGNVGTPLTRELSQIERDDILVTEVSSFQLESVNAFKSDIACVLNLSPDHLERHYSMENYVFLKKRLLKNLSQTEFAVLNYDDLAVREFSKTTNAKVFYISKKERVNGAYIEGDNIFYNGEFIIDKNDIPLVGEHNEYNVLFAVCVCKLLKVESSLLAEGIKNFKGIKHRMQIIQSSDGKVYYNDSKSTNTASTISAIRSLKIPAVLILGGSEKGETYDNLFKEIKDSLVKHTILTGASRLNMLDCAGKVNGLNITVTNDVKNAIEIASKLCRENEAVLFSPACASFDAFSGYEERGDFFINTVKELM